MQERPYLSIGEVLGAPARGVPRRHHLQDPISREPGSDRPRTHGVAVIASSTTTTSICLRVILREQRENFLPLRVIRDRLVSGAIEDPTGPTTPPRGIRSVLVVDETDADHDHDHDGELFAEPTPAPTAEVSAQPAAPPESDHRHDSFAADDLCHLAGLTAPQLAELESYGLLAGKGTGADTVYTAGDLAIAHAAAGFMQHGVEGRHLKAWRQAAEREASLFEQMILPLLRQRNPQARQQAVATLTSLTALGGELRSAIVHSALSHHLDG